MCYDFLENKNAKKLPYKCKGLLVKKMGKDVQPLIPFPRVLLRDKDCILNKVVFVT